MRRSMLPLLEFAPLLLLAAGAPVQTAPQAVPQIVPVTPKATATTTLIEAAPERGFHFPCRTQ
jgi:hypothetical protein